MLPNDEYYVALFFASTLAAFIALPALPIFSMGHSILSYAPAQAQPSIGGSNNSSESNNSQAQMTTEESNLNTSIADTIQFMHYIDTSGRFELDYPSDWTLIEAYDDVNDRARGFDVAWGSRNSTSTPPVTFTVSIPPEPIPSWVGKVRPERAMEVIIEENAARLNLVSISEPNLTNYTIGGQPAASILVRHNISHLEAVMRENPSIAGLNLVDLYVLSIINNNVFTIQFSTTEKDYLTLLPIIDRIIESIRITNL